MLSCRTHSVSLHTLFLIAAPLTQIDTAAVLKVADMDGDGVISFEDFTSNLSRQQEAVRAIWGLDVRVDVWDWESSLFVRSVTDNEVRRCCFKEGRSSMRRVGKCLEDCILEGLYRPRW